MRLRRAIWSRSIGSSVRTRHPFAVRQSSPVAGRRLPGSPARRVPSPRRRSIRVCGSGLARVQRKGAADCHAAEDRAVLKILREQQRAVLQLRCGDDHAVPPAQAPPLFDLSRAPEEHLVDRVRLPGKVGGYVLPSLFRRQARTELARGIDVVLREHLSCRGSPAVAAGLSRSCAWLDAAAPLLAQAEARFPSRGRTDSATQ